MALYCMLALSVLIVLSEVIAYNCLDLLKREYIQDVKDDMCFRPHADMSVILNLFYLGRGMILFRLLREIRTDVMKCAHGIITSGAIIGNFMFIKTAHVGIACFMYPFDNDYRSGSDGNIHWIANHFKIGRILVLWGFLQIGTSIIIFIFFDQSARRYFFGFHNTAGWLYYLLAAAEVSMKFVHHQKSVKNTDNPKLFDDWLMLHIFSYPFIILSILCIPFFEWPIVKGI